MLFDQGADVAVPGQTGADAFVVVEGHRHSVAGSAEGDATIDFSALDAAGQVVGEIGVIDARRSVGSVIHDGEPFPSQVCDQLLLVVVAGVIRCKSNFHIILLLFSSRFAALVLCPARRKMLAAPKTTRG